MKKFIILIPVYNDWQSVYKLLENIDLNINDRTEHFSVLMINDSSTTMRPFNNTKFKNIYSIRIINMKTNKGHARCYAAGLRFITAKEDFDYVILMDGDGEDRPEELGLILDKSSEYPLKTITANRVKRSEGPLFRLLYQFHKFLTYVFTGKLIKFGNYSCIPKSAATKLVKNASVWSSFSGSVTKFISERTFVPSVRGRRYFGPSQMNLFNLLIHSFSIIAVFKNLVVIRSFVFLALYFFLMFNNISVLTSVPILIILIFLFIIFKISLRENINELNNSLNNIDSIDTLSNSNNR